MKSGSDILKEILEFTGESKNSLAKSIKLKRSQNLYDIESGKVKNISLELSEKIVLAYPNIRREYLLTGIGEMLKNEITNANNKDLSFPIELTPADRAMILTNRDWLIRVVSEVFQMPIDKAKALLDQDTISKHDEIVKQP